MELFYPGKGITVDQDNLLDQAFLIQSILPNIANSKNNNKIYKFFKEYHKEQLLKSFEMNKRTISLNTSYGCDFESEIRFASIDDRTKHIKLMQNLTTVQKSALAPYVRLYLVPNPYTKTALDFKRNAIPLAFGKSFDLDFYLNKKRQGTFSQRLENTAVNSFDNTKISSTSRGELAAIQSMTVGRVYNQTNVFDPINIDMTFYFSSFDVFAHKPAIEASSGFETYLNRLSQGGGLSSFYSDLRDLRYTELITLQNKDFKLVVEYGWNVDDSVSEQVFSFLDKQRIKKFEKTFYLLNPQDHRINFSDDGSFTMSVKYVPSTVDSIFKSTDIKTGLLLNEEVFKKVKGAASENIQEKVKKIKKLNSLRYEDATKELKRLKDISKLKEELSSLKAVNYVNLFERFCRESDIIYRAAVETEVVDSKYVFRTTLAKNFTKSSNVNERPVPIGREASDFSLYNVNQIIDKIKTLRKKNKLETEDLSEEERLKDIDFLGFTKVGLTRITPEIRQDPRYKDRFDKLSRDIVKDVLINFQNRKFISFMLFRDVLNVIIELAKVSGPKDEIPYFVLGNFAMPLPNGKKYWCNVGDIPIELRTLKGNMKSFFNKRPKASFKDFLYYFLHDVFPSIVVQKGQKAALPTMSFPFFHFNQKKWDGNSKDKKNYFDLIDGKKESLTKFGKEYFNDSDFDGSIGCLFVGQSPRLSFENSSFFVGKNVKIASDAFLKNDEELLKVGIGKMLVGSSRGLVKRLSFNSSGDQYINNLNYELNKQKPGIGPVLISSAYQYTVSATLYGNRIYEFSNLIYIPAASLGYSPQSAEDALKRVGFEDFEIGGIYSINNITDQVDLKAGTYTKNISASTIRRESQLVGKALREVKKSNDKEVLFPSNGIDYTLPDYLYDNSEKIDKLFKVKIKKVLVDVLFERSGLELPIGQTLETETLTLGAGVGTNLTDQALPSQIQASLDAPTTIDTPATQASSPSGLSLSPQPSPGTPGLSLSTGGDS